MGIRSKRFDYRVAVDAEGTMRAEDGGPVRTPDGWTADHLVMAALVRCALGSLRHHADRAGLAMEGRGEAHGVVGRRGSDGRFALVEVAAALDVRLDPEPAPAQVAELLAAAERGCFVGASLTARPTYSWTVNGAAREVTAPA